MKKSNVLFVIFILVTLFGFNEKHSASTMSSEVPSNATITIIKKESDDEYFIDKDSNKDQKYETLPQMGDVHNNNLNVIGLLLIFLTLFLKNRYNTNESLFINKKIYRRDLT